MLTIINLTPRRLMGACLILVGLTGLTLLIALWQWHSDWKLSHSKVAAPIITDASETANLIAALPSAHLFGKSFADGGDMPISNLQLKVTGIMKANDENGNDVSKATISMGGEPSKIYQKGDTLPYGVKVYDITNDAVVLENDGHLEKLLLPRQPLQFKPRDSEEI